MKILVTGMTSRQTKEDRTVAGMTAEALRSQGHDVTVERPSLERVLSGEITETYDHAFVGLGPLHGIGTSYKYGALATIGVMWADKVTLYLDDVDSGKIGSGLRIMEKHNWKLTKPFYGYCAEYELASKPESVSWLLSIIDSLLHATDEHPNILVPAFTFDDAFKTAGKITGGAAQHVTPLDWSVMATSLKTDTDAAEGRYGPANAEYPDANWWSVEHVPEGRAVRSLGPFTWPVQQIDHKELGLIYQSAGYLAPGSAWTPRFYQVSSCGIPLVSPWRIFADHIGDAFEVLAGTIETMPQDERDDLAKRQLEQIEKFIPTKTELSQIVEGVMLRRHVSTARRRDKK